MTTKQRNRAAEARKNLKNIERIIARFEKKTKERPVASTHGRWANSLDLAAGAGVDPAPGGASAERTDSRS
jgi:hypothetical protein